MCVAWRGMLARRGTWCDATAMLRPLTATLLLLAAAPASAEERTYMIAGFDRVRVDGPFSVTVVAGDVTHVVLEATQGVRLMVVGRPPHPSRAGRWRRSVAHAVLATASCPLVVVG